MSRPVGLTPTPPDGEETPLPDAPPYWLLYSGRLVRFTTLDRTTRILALSGAAGAIGGLLVLTLPLAHLAAVSMPQALAAIRVPWLVLATATALQASGWWYLVTGAALGGARVRLPVAAALLVFAVTATPGGDWILLPILGLDAYLLLTAWRPSSARTARTVGAVGVALIFATMLRSGAALYAVSLLDQTAVSYLLLVPLIFYSGYDLGQSALHGVRFVLMHVHRRVGASVLTALVVAALVLKVVVLLTVEGGLSPSFLLAIPVLAAALLLSRHLGPEEERPPEFVPALAALLVLGALFGSGALGRVWADAAALALAGGAALALRARHGRAPPHAAVYLVVFGLWNLFNRMTMHPGGAGLVGGWLWPIDARGLDEAVSLAALAYCGWLALRRALTPARLLLVLFWLVGMSLVLALWGVLSGLKHLSHGALAAEALLLAVGIGHDVAASGGLLNRGSRTVGRPSRVLLYLGYLLVICGSTVLADGSAGPTAGAIRSDALQQGGLILIGIPLYLQMFAHALAVGRPAPGSDDAADEAPTAKAPEPGRRQRVEPSTMS